MTRQGSSLSLKPLLPLVIRSWKWFTESSYQNEKWETVPRVRAIYESLSASRNYTERNKIIRSCMFFFVNTQDCDCILSPPGCLRQNWTRGPFANQGTIVLCKCCLCEEMYFVLFSLSAKAFNLQWPLIAYCSTKKQCLVKSSSVRRPKLWEAARQ